MNALNTQKNEQRVKRKIKSYY